jgi:hypothetical protein
VIEVRGRDPKVNRRKRRKKRAALAGAFSESGLLAREAGLTAAGERLPAIVTGDAEPR